MFAAVVPPAEVIDDLDAFLEVRREAGPFRWPQADQLHLTLAFMADVADHKLDGLVDRLERAAQKRRPTTATITGGGAFPNVARAKVLWAGVDVDDPAELDRLASGARTAASTSGIEVDGRRFRRHVTVARMGRPVETTPWVRLLDAYRGPSWALDEVALVASHLGEGPRRRPRYETVATFPLGRGAT
jgi:2'-5' RNA ligase